MNLNPDEATYRHCNICKQILVEGDNPLITLYVSYTNIQLEYKEGLTAMPIHRECLKKIKGEIK